jgi:cell division protein FtsW
MSQAVLNIASTTSALPFTGVPLPFISYGGSSLVMSFVAAGLLLNISAHPAPSVAPTVVAKETPQPPSAPHFSEILKLHHRANPRRRYRSRRPVRTVRTR